MRTEDIQNEMRAIERSYERKVEPGKWIVACLDGRSFTRLTKEILPFERPLDQRFRDYMVKTAAGLYKCGFKVLYAYTQSDEISVVIPPEDNTFDRRIQKIVSLLAAEASAVFSGLVGQKGVFDCRVLGLPDTRSVVDYLKWRAEVAARNCASAHLYYYLRDRLGKTGAEASEFMKGKSLADLIGELAKLGIDFRNLPSWQKRGAAIVSHREIRSAVNPETGENVSLERISLRPIHDLPSGEDYTSFLLSILGEGKKDSQQEPVTGETTEAQETEEADSAPLARKIILSSAGRILRAMNKEMKRNPSELLDEGLAHLGLNYTDQLSIKHQSLSYAEFEFGFEVRLDEAISKEISTYSPSDWFILRQSGLDEKKTAAEIKKSFGEILDEHFNTKRMQKILARHDWI